MHKAQKQKETSFNDWDRYINIYHSAIRWIIIGRSDLRVATTREARSPSQWLIRVNCADKHAQRAHTNSNGHRAPHSIAHARTLFFFGLFGLDVSTTRRFQRARKLFVLWRNISYESCLEEDVVFLLIFFFFLYSDKTSQIIRNSYNTLYIKCR